VSSRILRCFGDNATEGGRVEAVVATLTTDSVSIRVNKLGWSAIRMQQDTAQPEGGGASPAENSSLSLTNRQQQLTRYRALLKKKIAKAFQIFDATGKGVCSKEDLRNVIHALDMNPSEQQVNEFITQISEDEEKEVQYEKFEAAIIVWRHKIVLW